MGTLMKNFTKIIFFLSISFYITSSLSKEVNNKVEDSLFKTGMIQYNMGDYKNAIINLELSANKGNSDAQNNLGVMYNNGMGVDGNQEQSVKWYSIAAHNGNAIAQSNLAVKYVNGNGVISNNHLAYMWFLLSLKNGNYKAQNGIDYLSDKITEQQINKIEKDKNKCFNSNYFNCTTK